MSELSDDALKEVERGMTAMRLLERKAEDRRVLLEQAEQRIKLLELEIDSMGKQVLRAEQDREAALGRKDEAEAAHVAIRTKLEAISAIVREYEPAPRKTNGAADVGQAAVAGAVKPTT